MDKNKRLMSVRKDGTMINSVVLTGRLTKEPELRYTRQNTPTISFVLAVDRAIKKDGQPDADFISCIAWNKTAELMAQYLHKGSLIGIEGRIQTRNYENQQGQRVYVTEVVANSVQFLESKNAQNAQYQSNNAQTKANNSDQRTDYQQSKRNQHQPNMNFTNADVDTFDIGYEDLPF